MQPGRDTKATAERFRPVTNEELDSGFLGWVHVEGWAAGACFRYISRTESHYIIKTPKTGREYRVPVSQRLLHTRDR